MLKQTEITDFFKRQLQIWPEAAARFTALDNVMTRHFDIDGFPVTISHNPARIQSSAAKVDKASIAARRCFLCDANRPPRQQHIDWRDYRILVNPFPILPEHFTIIAKEHRPQSIKGAIADMTQLAMLMPDFAIFYNGPACGASAPDHFHFQAVRKSALPMFSSDKLPFDIIRLSGEKASQHGVDAALDCLPRDGEESEPKVNIFCSSENGTPEITIIPRRRHRPDFYGEDGMLISPASIDLAGVIVAPRRSDFDSITPEIIKDIYSQLCFSRSEINSFQNDNTAH
ncbi:MAG: DUF4922 domain-containing protein [Muribaculaceae bacterium]|nr:DUF4922 domain-containing protein [Muribaculaceae bacterium]